jgi:hypothetical protein
MSTLCQFIRITRFTLVTPLCKHASGVRAGSRSSQDTPKTRYPSCGSEYASRLDKVITMMEGTEMVVIMHHISTMYRSFLSETYLEAVQLEATHRATETSNTSQRSRISPAI